MRRCTVCHSTNVRRSGAHPAEASQHPFRSPYRCLDCDMRFWVVSRRTRVGAAAGGALALALVLAMALPSLTRLSSAQFNPRSSTAPELGPNAGTESVTQQTVDDILRAQSDVLTRQSAVNPPVEPATGSR